MRQVYVSSKVDTRIEALRKSGRAGAALARKATRIIESLASGVFRHRLHAVGSTTKYGENRIKNCLKYDLGCGYRLITLQRGSTLFIPFFGAHDECQRWLEQNSRLKKISAGKGTFFEVSRKPVACENSTITNSADSQAHAEDEVEVELKLSDRQLRRVFSGLVKGVEKHTAH